MPVGRVLRAKLSRFSVLLLAAALTGCGSGILQLSSTTVAPLASEDIAGPCRYDIDNMGAEAQQGILVLFERGDTSALYQDPSFRQAIHALHYTVVWAHECLSLSENNLQPDATKGQTRMLFAALSNLASLTNHPELATTGVILYGFSAAGVLTASMANDHPDRLLGTIQYAAGSAYVNLDSISVSTAAASIPTLILANAQDRASGTSRSYRYFQRGRALGAHWAYGVQNATNHCCNLSTRNVVLAWIQSVAASNVSAAVAQNAAAAAPAGPGALSHFLCSPDGVKDGQGEINCEFVAAGLGQGSTGSMQGSTGWLPDQTAATAWLAWVTNPTTN